MSIAMHECYRDDRNDQLGKNRLRKEDIMRFIQTISIKLLLWPVVLLKKVVEDQPNRWTAIFIFSLIKRMIDSGFGQNEEVKKIDWLYF